MRGGHCKHSPVSKDIMLKRVSLAAFCGFLILLGLWSGRGEHYIVKKVICMSGIITLFPARENLVSNIPAGDIGKSLTFFPVYIPVCGEQNLRRDFRTFFVSLKGHRINYQAMLLYVLCSGRFFFNILHLQSQTKILKA
jgi:hypothetical protein